MKNKKAQSESTKNEILIVDDIPKNLQLISDILYQEGLSISIATNGQKALKAIEAKSFDLILLDITMPDMDGYEICRQLKQNPETKDIPVIFLTARVNTEDIIRGFKVGAVDYVTKPYSSEELVARVFTHLELKRSKDIIKNQNKELHKLVATRNKLFSIISHDMRIPLGTLVGFIKNLIDEFDNYEIERVKKSLFLIQDSANQSVYLMNMLYEWAKAQTGKLKTYPRWLSVKNIVEKNIELLRCDASQKDIDIITTVDSLKIFGDFEMLSTIVRNVLSNAIKFTNRGGVVQISAENIEDEEQKIKIVIKDNGVGMNYDKISNLFRTDAFISTLGTENEKGLGLGLELCKEFAERNFGTIHIDSVIGEGTEVTLIFPAHEYKHS